MANKMLKRIFRRQRNPAGFTLIELLVTVVIGSIILSGLLFLVNDLLRTDKQEFALAETEREMQMAADYIAADLQEAVYVYEGECLTGRADAPATTVNEYCPGLSSILGLTNNNDVMPVLALWKLDAVPYSDDQSLPTFDDCENDFPATAPETQVTQQQCKSQLITRNSYTLVVYSLSRENPNNLWEPSTARLTRYELRKYNTTLPNTLKNLVINQGYRDPSPSFQSWPNDSNGSAPPSDYQNPVYSSVPLVDLVDYNTQPAFSQPPCAPNYSLTPPNALNNAKNSNKLITGFYACVRIPTDNQGRSVPQDVIVYLRGNAIKRAGKIDSDNRDSQNLPTTYLPTVKTQVQVRGIFNRIPPRLN